VSDGPAPLPGPLRKIGAPGLPRPGALLVWCRTILPRQGEVAPKATEGEDGFAFEPPVQPFLPLRQLR